MKKIEKNKFDLSKLQSIAKDILKEAARNGADQAEVSIDANKGFSVSAREGEVETIEYNQDKMIDITVYIGKRTGSAGISDLQPKAILAAVEAACHIAKFTDEDESSGIADKNELAFNYPKLDLDCPWNISVEEAIEIACQCEQEALAYDKRIMVSEETRVATVDAVNIYANSHGFEGFYPSSQHEISCVLVAKDGDEMQRDYSYSIAVDPTQLESVKQIARDAAERTVSRLGARRVATEKVPVIYIAEAARSLIGYFAGAIQGSSLYRKSSFLLDHLDKQVFPAFIQIKEHPHLHRALGSAPFDDDGVKTRPNIFIEDGVLRSYSLDVYSARKMNMKSTGNAGGMHNLSIGLGNKDLIGLQKAMGRGMLITEMMGQGVNLLTGDYSRGASGFWIENGEIQFPVNEVTVAGNLKDMFARIAEVGNDLDKRGNIRTGSILIDEIMIAGD